MRILHIITTIERGGAEKQLLILAKEQIALGYEVEVIYLKGQPELENEFLESGVTVNPLLQNRNFLYQIHLLRNYGKNKNILFHAHLPRAELLLTLALPRSTYVVSRHNSESFMPKFPRFLSSSISRGVTRYSSGVVAISQAVKDYIQKNNEVSKSSEVQVILYGADKNRSGSVNSFSRDLLGISDSDFIFGTVGRLVPQKDYPTLLTAFKKFRLSCPNAKLIIVGSGSEESKLKEFANKLGLANSILWLGRVSKVEELMTIFDAFILTSIYEGFGLVFLEAMTQELPIISTNHSSVPEVLGPDYPLLCNVRDPDDIAEKMLLLLEKSYIDQIKDILRGRLVLFDSSEMAKKFDMFYKRAS